MNPFSLIFGGVVEAGKAIFGQWMETKRTKIIAQQTLQQQIQAGTIEYNVAAQQGMAASIKDELLTIWFITMMSLNFIPSMQPYMKEGWSFMQAYTPDWFAWCFCGIVVAVFGLKGYKGIKNGGDGNGKV